MNFAVLIGWMALQAALGQNLREPQLIGDKKKAAEVWGTVKKWTEAYSKRDLKAVMEVFDSDEVFSFAGGPDSSYAQLEAGYRAEFAQTGAIGDWIPLVDEVYAEGKTAYVRGIAELHVQSPDGTVKITDRNRCIDIYRLRGHSQWRIFRTLCYPEPLKHIRP
jgi:ketosteroid isomerase-like protein